MTVTKAQFDEFIGQLSHHDWYYAYSDDHSVWRRGETAQARLEHKAKSDPIYKQAYDIWVGAISRQADKAVRDNLIGILRAGLVD